MNKASIGNNSTSSSNSSLDPLTTNLIGSSGSYPLTQKDVNKYMIAAIIATIVAVKSNFINEIWTIKSCLIINQVILLLILFVMRKRIKLVVQLFYEAGKAVQSMPLLLIQPIWVNNLSSFFIYCFFPTQITFRPSWQLLWSLHVGQSAWCGLRVQDTLWSVPQQGLLLMRRMFCWYCWLCSMCLDYSGFCNLWLPVNIWFVLFLSFIIVQVCHTKFPIRKWPSLAQFFSPNKSHKLPTLPTMYWYIVIGTFTTLLKIALFFAQNPVTLSRSGFKGDALRLIYFKHLCM